jgi:signal transduction histidine kinase
MAIAYEMEPSRDPLTHEELNFIATVESEMRLALDRCRLIARLEQEQAQARKVEQLVTMGVVVAGVVHDIRKLLAGIKLNAELLAEELPSDDARREYLADIIRASESQEEVLNGLLTSVRTEVRPKPVELRELVRSVMRDVRPALNAHEGVLLAVDDDHCERVALDATQLRRALANLVVNAIEATPAGGTVTFECCVNEGSYGNDGVEFAIRDQGSGIAPEHLQRLFEPLFTTKSDGTGLGLAIAKQIVEAHGGTIAVKATPGAGATFTVRIPMDSHSPGSTMATTVEG